MSPTERAHRQAGAATDLADVDVPEALSTRLSLLHEVESTPRTLADWVEASREAFDQAGLEVGLEALVAGEPTRHEARFGDRTVHTYCLMDALVLPFVALEIVEVESTCPWTGETIEVKASAEAVSYAPGTAVTSVGAPPLDETEDGLPGDLDHDRAHENLCPYINGFRSGEDHDAWAADHPSVASLAVPLEVGYEVGRAFVRG
jgi:hypothetical protein